MQMEQTLEKIDLELLPEEARKELIDFYEFLLNKYGVKKRRNLPKGFYSPIKVKSYIQIAKREEIYEG
nr:DUF2281 domain-containing protein [Desulfurobacterium thermolithotrophum]